MRKLVYLFIYLVNAIPGIVMQTGGVDGGKPELGGGLATVKVEKAEIGIADKDQSGPLKTTPLQFPQYSSNILEVDQQQKVILKFSLKDTNSNEPLTAHQVFVQVLNDESKKEHVYVAEMETGTDTYKFDLNLAQRGKDLGFNSGLYHISLIVGDSMINNPFVWKLASARVTFTSGQAQALQDKGPWMKSTYSPKPVINHIFREQDKRPPTFVSDTFALLTLVPVLILFGLWAKLGANLSGFSFSLSGLLFHLGLGSIFALFTCLWLQLNMFTTIKYLLGLGLITFLSGHSLLSKLASKKGDK
ncbi:dolichyl-diphosphooligosaccharide--protein glycosyltransferase subunit 2-like [Panonychus citri]|uniref:dolichyl-diphosphooligosaccharide--protein glycosyltransferase subunit 2-like n=1 Tax=Panonychus citri TaxID=50023 RepID=UPI00230825C9|nr:dolichyl-diphosphooligosaccharide--protein glycosyltransferase subunit 2-like [Panonychus citri]